MLLALFFHGKTCLGCCEGSVAWQRNSVLPNSKPHHFINTRQSEVSHQALVMVLCCKAELNLIFQQKPQTGSESVKTQQQSSLRSLFIFPESSGKEVLPGASCQPCQRCVCPGALADFSAEAFVPVGLKFLGV